MRILTLESGIWLPKPLKEVFPFFTDARNLELLTPPWLRFEVLEQTPNQMTAGTRIDYRLRLRGIPIRWQSRITVWDPPERFVDEQIPGAVSALDSRASLRGAGWDDACRGLRAIRSARGASRRSPLCWPGRATNLPLSARQAAVHLRKSVRVPGARGADVARLKQPVVSDPYSF